MSRIEKLTLKNFKCHKSIDLSFSPLTVLTGGNASGKSSVIQSILMAYNTRHMSCGGFLRASDIYGINLGLPSTILSNNHSDERIDITLYIGGKENSVSLSPFGEDVDELSFKIIGQVSPSDFEGGLRALKLYYLNAERLGPRIISEIFNYEGNSVGSRGENTGFIIDKLNMLSRKDDRYKISEALRLSKNELFIRVCEQWLNKIVPGTDGLDVTLMPELNLSTITYNGGGKYLPTATGFGITFVLPIIVQALAASLENNAVVIVENPEAHLHPASQSAIGKFLALVATQNVQVIIETHSEHVINGCRLQLAQMRETKCMSVAFFVKGEYEAALQMLSISETGELSSWPAGFFDQSRNDIRDLMELRKNV